MAIDEVRNVEVHNTSEGQKNTGMMTALAVVVALLVIGQIYTLNKLGSLNALRASIETEDSKIHEQLVSQLNDRFSNQLTDFSNQNAQRLDALKTELDVASRRAGSAGRELKHARAMVAQLQTAQEQEAQQLKQQIDLKADQQQVGALRQDMSTTKSDLSSTKTKVDTLSSDLGMARSELGTLIARNHEEVDALRRQGERDYVEFTVDGKNKPQKVGGITVELRGVDLKKNKFTVALTVDDVRTEKKDRTIDEPVIFYPHGSHQADEFVVNSVGKNKITGYVSMPKNPTATTANAGS